jgi:hypothetical protein
VASQHNATAASAGFDRQKTRRHHIQPHGFVEAGKAAKIQGCQTSRSESEIAFLPATPPEFHL